MPLGMAAVMATTLSFVVGELDQGIGEDLGVGALARRLGLARLRDRRARGRETSSASPAPAGSPALLRKHVQQHRAVLRLEELEGLDQRADVVAVDAGRSS